MEIAGKISNFKKSCQNSESNTFKFRILLLPLRKI